ncbi:uroporphyrinogen-III synthase [Mycolicibacterium aichiense]|uniref:Transcriptional regulatory protein n=1 Tax=Mycolicibacterium aichiense TaxID=1799 RepID=A0AAD1MCX2_9MYCO|nr:uroporphyrinogen-III synthase [Mycolicibacterium aichiense]MCV7020088.1 uroporphyrinogen-III synthase [Mycolicibacterium aichiense]BBX07684.1 putative transcriptional regulatory protein [Mycolicibacterium aichiense]STZ81497.1 uroporphyrinogen-III synthase [Mycolicibacterium aichiense]
MDSSRSEVADPLAGFTVGVTAARRAEEFITLLERRGAAVVHAPTIRIVPLVDDVELHRVTEQLIAEPPDLVVVTTGIGFRGWVEAGHGWDVHDGLLAALGSTRILARGPKARGAVRQAGLCEEWSPESESSVEVLERLLSEGVDQLRIAVQLHGAASEWEPDTDICDALTRAGAQVVKVPVYRWEQPEDTRRIDQLIGMIVNSDVDAVSFTSAPAVASLLERAKAIGALDCLITALRNNVAVFCVGPVTATPLARLGIEPRSPQRYRLGALARLITDELPCLAKQYRAGGHRISVRSASVEVDGELKVLPPAGMALLRRLLVAPGLVVSREELLAELPGGGDDTHAVETAMARLRSALAAPRVVQTVVKRGYRLAVDVEAT